MDSQVAKVYSYISRLAVPVVESDSERSNI